MIVISDTSPINYLVLVGQQDILPSLFGRVIMPEAVLNELKAAATPPQVHQWIANRPAWIEVKTPTGPPETNLFHLDEGEREAIQLAEEVKADLLIIDERAGREEALKRSLPVIGTLGILERAAELGMLDFALVLAELKAYKFFVAAALEQDFLDRDVQRKARGQQQK